MRGRGLKLEIVFVSDQDIGVAPHAGAWIETFGFMDAQGQAAVAPHAGAWIETLMKRT